MTLRSRGLVAIKPVAATTTFPSSGCHPKNLGYIARATTHLSRSSRGGPAPSPPPGTFTLDVVAAQWLSHLPRRTIISPSICIERSRHAILGRHRRGKSPQGLLQPQNCPHLHQGRARHAQAGDRRDPRPDVL